jgi:hypothetical protein
MIRPSKIKKMSAITVIMGSLMLLLGCEQSLAPDLGTNNSVSQASGRIAYMRVSARFSPSRPLGKLSTVSPDKLVLLIVSNSQDTLRDTISAPPVGSSDSSTRTIIRDYEVQALRSWSVAGEVVDDESSVIQEGSATTQLLYAQDTAKVSLNLARTTIGRVGTSTLIVVIPTAVLD